MGSRALLRVSFLFQCVMNFLLWILVIACPPTLLRPKDIVVRLLVLGIVVLSFVGICATATCTLRNVMTRPVLGHHVLGLLSKSMLMYTLMFVSLRWCLSALGDLPEPLAWVVRGAFLALILGVLSNTRRITLGWRLGIAFGGLLSLWYFRPFDLLAILALASLVWGLSRLNLTAVPRRMPWVLKSCAILASLTAALLSATGSDLAGLAIAAVAGAIAWWSMTLDEQILRDVAQLVEPPIA